MQKFKCNEKKNKIERERETFINSHSKIEIDIEIHIYVYKIECEFFDCEHFENFFPENKKKFNRHQK